MRLTTRDAGNEDAGAVAALRNAVAAKLTADHGRGAWTGSVSDKGVAWDLRRGRIILAIKGKQIVGTLSLGTIKPWAIDRSYFSRVKRPLYLTSMAVEPTLQRQGVGRFMLEVARKETLAWPAGGIRLDAFQGPAGAGAFYAKCGFENRGEAQYREAKLIYFEWLAQSASGG